MKKFIEMSDEELMFAAASGAQEAFTELITRYQDMIYNYFYRVSGSCEIAEDYAQETFVNIYRRIENYQKSAKFKTYIFRVAKNRWIDHIRKVSRRDVVVDYPLDLCVARDCSDPSKRLENNELSIQLERAVGELPEKLQETFVLGQIKELKYEDIAQIQEIPLGTVKSRMYTAMKMLRKSLTACGLS